MQTRSSTASEQRRRMRDEAEANSAEYRDGYPDASSTTARTRTGRDNWNFYSNKIRSEPNGDFIEAILTDWRGDYDLLERHHGYIQWLFPLRESGVNWQASVMSPEEVARISASPECLDRLLRAYSLMLDFYGFRLACADTGAVEPAENFAARIAFLNTSGHNYLRISRILKSLGEFGLERFKAPWVKALVMLCFSGEKPLLRRARSACEFHWVFTLKSEAERRELLGLIDSLLEEYPQNGN